MIPETRIRQLSLFLGRASRDNRLSPTHVSVYMGLYQQCMAGGFQNPFPIESRKVMAVARVRSRVTYHKCLQELQRWGYIHYAPSYSYYQRSLVYLLHLRERK